MRCVRCRARPEVYLRAHNAAFCRACYIPWFQRQVERTLTSGRMCTRDDQVLVAVSGGKDSLALWDALVTLGYRTSGLHVAQGIGGYSATSREKVERFARDRGLPLLVHDLADEGLAIPEVASTTRRAPCSACGTLKRYAFDRVAHVHGFAILATGHNLDDEAARLLGNLLRWQTTHLARQRPVLDPRHPTQVRKIRPLVLVSEYETAAYAFLRGIDYVVEECPYAEGATQLLYKEALDRIEAGSPGTKLAFVREFFRSAQPLFAASEPADGAPPRSCTRCGMPAFDELCAHCRLLRVLAPAGGPSAA